jgi:hypothetical protein
MNAVVLILVLLVSVLYAAPAAAQRDNMQLGERISAQLIRPGAIPGPPLAGPPPASCAPTTREPLPLTDRISTERKGPQ